MGKEHGDTVRGPLYQRTVRYPVHQRPPRRRGQQVPSLPSSPTLLICSIEILSLTPPHSIAIPSPTRLIPFPSFFLSDTSRLLSLSNTGMPTVSRMTPSLESHDTTSTPKSRITPCKTPTGLPSRPRSSKAALLESCAGKKEKYSKRTFELLRQLQRGEWGANLRASVVEEGSEGAVGV